MMVERHPLMTDSNSLSGFSVGISLNSFLLFVFRAEGSSKIHSRLEQQTSRLGQQMKSSSSSSSSISSNNKSFTSSKSSPPKEKASPTSPMDDIERGAARQDVHLKLLSQASRFLRSLLSRACAELMAEARVMDQLSSGDSSSDSNSSSSSSSDDSSSSSESEDEQTGAPAKHGMPVINTSGETNSHHQERAGGLMNTLSESLSTFTVFTHTSFSSRDESRPESGSGVFPE